MRRVKGGDEDKPKRVSSANDLAQLDTDAWQKNKSYTDLAALATGYEAERPRSARRGSSEGADERGMALYAQAMELINKGLKMDVTSPMEAVEYYQRGSDLVSEALDIERDDEAAERYQRTLDMCSERVRYILRMNNRLQTDSQLRLKLSEPGSVLDVLEDDTLVMEDASASALRPSYGRRATRNLFAMEQMDSLPPRIRQAHAQVADAFTFLARRFGFQQESVRCQTEHLVLLLANTTSHEGDRALSVLHARMFANYRLWAAHIGAEPQCARTQDVPNSKATDLALELLIWGEASNLRHMPECICFLFHSMRAELRAAAGAPHRSVSRPPGWFLSRAVAPLYRTVRQCMHAKKAGSTEVESHTLRANYDDCNEFFWSPVCLQYAYYDPPGEDVLDVQPPNTAATLGGARPWLMGAGPQQSFFKTSFAGGAAPKPISEAPFRKTYVERRSWLHPIKSFWRIHAYWQLVAHGMVACAMCSGPHGILLDARLCQWLLHVLPAQCFYSLVGEALEVYVLWGAFRERRAETASAAVRIALKAATLAGLVAAYGQLSWDDLEPGTPAGPRALAFFDAHPAAAVGLAVYAVPQAMGLLLPFLPGVSTWLRERKSGPVRFAMDLWYPANRLFIARDIHELPHATFNYMLFWTILVYFKVWFSYNLQIAPLIPPTEDIWRRRSQLGLGVSLVLAAVRWVPILITYHLDVQIWYTLLSALYGMVIGWKLRIGEVRDIQGIRRRFVAATAAFNASMLSYQARRRLGIPDDEDGGLAASTACMPVTTAKGAADAAGALYLKMRAIAGAPVQAGAAPEASVELRHSLLAGKAPQGAQGPADLGEAAQGEDASGSERTVFFAEAWNEIVGQLRHSDLVSNREQGCLLFRDWRQEGTGGRFARAVYLPVLCTAGRVASAIDLFAALCEELWGSGPAGAAGVGARGLFPERRRQDLERRLSAAFARDRHLAEAVLESWELTFWMVGAALGPRHMPALLRLAGEADELPGSGRRLEAFVPSQLQGVVRAAVDLANTLLAYQPPPPPSAASAPPSEPAPSPGAPGSSSAPSKAKPARAAAPPPAKPVQQPPSGAVGKVVDKVRALLDAMRRATGRNATKTAELLDSLKYTQDGFFWNEAYAADQVAALLADDGNRKRLRGLVLLLTTPELDAQPRGREAQRRLTWFVNSLFMRKPAAPPVSEMPSWTIMTPYYSEDLVYSEAELRQTNEDGISVIFFLQKAHPADWANFLERVGCKDEAEVRRRGLMLELRLWASFRGQTLMRTVDGEMICEKALRLQARWDGVPEGEIEDLVRQKFSCIVSCQIYGQMRRSKSPKAADTEFLLRRYPNLRIAYVDRTSSVQTVVGEDGLASLTETIRWYSVLIRADSASDQIVEIYRVQLPGDPILGEGKPENQNHAAIFTRGEALQTLDMNQAGYLEEAFKMRNLLMEFGANSEGRRPCTIVGFREHIFTQGLTSLATFMGLQEGCFVSLSQRVLWAPLRARMHYGHPDIFDKVFCMANGGVSKASKGINLSEDIFAGFNHTLRGGRIAYAEYAQVGKGRDVGMHQIYKFEAKLSQGNGEQMISRDVSRLGARLDFGRLLAFYYSAPGFYLNVALTVVCIYVFLYLQLWVSLFPLDPQRLPHADVLSLEWVLQLGLLLIIPTFFFLAVEYGVVYAAYEIVRTVACGSPLFFMFHMGTKAHYVSSTLKFGGARYRPTGRGFVMRHEDFAEIFRFFAGSHFYPGFELLAALLLWLLAVDWEAQHGVGHYWRAVWSMWAIAISWIFAPFWFNPVALEWRKLESDLSDWRMWMARTGSSADKSWLAWHEEEMGPIYNTRSHLKRLHFLTPTLRYLITFCGMINLASPSNDGSVAGYVGALQHVIAVLGVVAVCAVVLLGGERLLESLEADMPLFRRLYSLLGTGLCLLALLVPLQRGWTTVGQIIHALAAGCYLCAALVQLCCAAGVRSRVVTAASFAYDFALGLVLMALLFILAAPGFVDQLQVRTLFNAAFNRGLRYADLLVSIPQKGD